MIREPAAEFFGVMILIIFGNGVDCQVVLSSSTGVASFQHGVRHAQAVEYLLNYKLGLPIHQLRLGCRYDQLLRLNHI